MLEECGRIEKSNEWCKVKHGQHMVNAQFKHMVQTRSTQTPTWSTYRQRIHHTRVEGQHRAVDCSFKDLTRVCRIPPRPCNCQKGPAKRKEELGGDAHSGRGGAAAGARATNGGGAHEGDGGGLCGVGGGWVARGGEECGWGGEECGWGEEKCGWGRSVGGWGLGGCIIARVVCVCECGCIHKSTCTCTTP